VSDLWIGKEAKRWSDHVGTHGDPFQQRYLKAFVLSCILAEPNSPLRLNSLFPRILHRIMDAPLDLLAEVPTWKKVAGEFTSAPVDLSEHLVVDLGCGEGFMQRFLYGFNATCIGLDYSAALIAEARRKHGSAQSTIMYEIADFRKDFQLTEIIDRLITPKSVNDFKVLTVISINTLDHIADPINLMTQVHLLCRQHKNATFILSTLNPAFYFKLGSPSRVSANDIAKQASLDIHLIKTRSITHIYPRGWGSYNGFFSSAGFNVEYFYATDLDDFPDNEPIPEVPDWPRAGGPFLLWRLIPVHSYQVDIAELDRIFSNLELFSAIDSKTYTTLKTNIHRLALRKFNRDDIVAMPGAICRGLSVVTKGSFVVTIDKSVVQDFPLSTAFGDLESSCGFYAGRYQYEVRAGSRGGECLDIPTDVLYSLLNGTGHAESKSQDLSPTNSSIGDRLFLTMRDRFNAYNYFYHRSIEIRPSQHPSPSVKTSKHFINNRSLSLRDIEHVIRCLVTLVALQEVKFAKGERFVKLDDVDRVPGLAIFVNPKDLKIWLSGREPGAKERPFASELEVLHKLGLIDAFSIPRIDEGGKHELRNMINGFFDNLVRSAVSMIVGRQFAVVRNKVLSDQELADIIQANHIDQLVTSQVVRNLSAEAIRLTANCTKAMHESQHALYLLFDRKHKHEARQIAISYYYNIAFLKCALFGRDERRLIVIRDYQFFRRVTGGGLQWIDELQARLELRDRMVKGSRDWSHLARVENYFSYVSAYVRGHWVQGWDLDYSGPRSRHPEGSWRSRILSD
jgi:2-polyprenyl-3-methyl-5-hydroxy-6-metoxy-1,4-benzoquinol methylase